jgi:hypothetical protein
LLGNRRKKAEQIARVRLARRLKESPHITEEEAERVPPPTKDNPHREASDFDAGYLTKWNGGCNCDRCREVKAKRRKGKGKEAWVNRSLARAGSHPFPSDSR